MFWPAAMFILFLGVIFLWLAISTGNLRKLDRELDEIEFHLQRRREHDEKERLKRVAEYRAKKLRRTHKVSPKVKRKK